VELSKATAIPKYADRSAQKLIQAVGQAKDVGSWNEGGGRTTGTPSPPGCRRLRRWTYRTTFGGALASRELWFGRSGSDRYLSLLWGLVTRVSGRIPFGASCPRWSLAREASTLSLVTCHAGFSRCGIDPVGETFNVPDTPLGSRRLVVSPPASTSWMHPCSSHK